MYAANKSAPWNISLYGSHDLAMYYTVVPGSKKNVGVCVCAALKRADDFAQELLQWVTAWNLTGIHTDWEVGSGNNLVRQPTMSYHEAPIGCLACPAV
jgi:hypothetical protein